MGQHQGLAISHGLKPPAFGESKPHMLSQNCYIKGHLFNPDVVVQARIKSFKPGISQITETQTVMISLAPQIKLLRIHSCKI